MVDLVQSGSQTFLDKNGDPLAAGLVYMYVPNTSTFKDTWQDSGGSVLNSNPIVLDQAGRAVIWGVDQYRQVVVDQFGNVQWDRIAEAAPVFSGTITGNLHVTGETTVDGGVTVGDNLAVNQNLVVAGNTSLQQVITGGNVVVGGVLGVDANSQFNGVAVFEVGLKTDSLSCNGSSIMESSCALRITQNVQPNGLTVIDSNFIVESSDHLSITNVNDDRIIVSTAGQPNITFNNTTLGPAFTVWSDGGKLKFGTATSGGSPTFEGMLLDAAGNGSIVGTFDAASSISALNLLVHTPGVGTVGTALDPWQAMYAHAFNVVSTDVNSALLADGQLAVVMGIPVKTEPHIGISADDAYVVEGAVGEGGLGTNYNILVGVLWKALQELSAKFDAYVAAHP